VLQVEVKGVRVEGLALGQADLAAAGAVQAVALVAAVAVEHEQGESAVDIARIDGRHQVAHLNTRPFQPRWQVQQW
jgi:hypothetical protein